MVLVNKWYGAGVCIMIPIRPSLLEQIRANHGDVPNTTCLNIDELLTNYSRHRVPKIQFFLSQYSADPFQYPVYQSTFNPLLLLCLIPCLRNKEN